MTGIKYEIGGEPPKLDKRLKCPHCGKKGHVHWVNMGTGAARCDACGGTWTYNRKPQE